LLIGGFDDDQRRRAYGFDDMMGNRGIPLGYWGLIALTLFEVLASSARAAIATTSFGVSATVLSSCSATAALLAFGVYSPGGGAVLGSTSISVKCTKTTPFTVALNVGVNSGSTFGQRLMAAGANRLQYNLYSTVALSSIFGDGTGGSVTVGGTGLGVNTAALVTVYGQLPDGSVNQLAVPGSYSDTITVTVTY
jgi:spore coat protein U-like protein